MKIGLVTPWPNVWVPMFEAEIKGRGHEFRLFHPHDIVPGGDAYIHGWSISSPVDGARNVMFMRAYEIYEQGLLEKIQWDLVDHAICVSGFMGGLLAEWLHGEGHETPVTVIPNAVDTNRWTFKNREFNGRLGMACHIHWKKNLPLALQICAALPEGTELHIAGEMQDKATGVYLHEAGRAMRRKIVLCGQLPHDHMDRWWEQFGVCLSTSIREGNPNNVLEAMAKGIKPVVHCWPGAEEQFPGQVFRTVSEAAEMILAPAKSEHYRAFVEERHGLLNISRVVDIAEGRS